MRVRQRPAPPAPASSGRAPKPAEVLARRRAARDRSLRFNGVLLLLVVAGLAFVWAVREIPNPALPPARELTTDMETVYRAQRAGDLRIDTEVSTVADGVEGVTIPRPDGDRWVLTGTAGRDCYALWWDEEGVRRVRTVPSDLDCAPSSWLTASHYSAYDRVGPAVEEDAPLAAWDAILPEPVTNRVWYLPALIVLAGIGLSALVRITIALLTGDAPSASRR
ncbi:hypothetical protein [Egicoccus sp. AB-alg2]|uniref:hypothetical protein n=1 Tax=Egicoccus sp. AB-alg2 TaxID=3242693 RepID=UPI00359EC1DB